MNLFHDFLYAPIYNLLIALVGVMPGGDGGMAVIALTIIVKLVTLPLSFAAIRTQKALKEIEPELKKLREEHKDDREKQAKEMFALYKKYKIRPFASILTILIQLPILFALFWVFQHESLALIDVPLLYSFVAVPETISLLFLGVFAITTPNIILAVLAGVTQYIQGHFTIQIPAKSEEAEKGNADAIRKEFGRAFALQMRIILPFIIGIVAFTTSGAIALYFITSNIIGTLQELLVLKKMRNKPL